MERRFGGCGHEGHWGAPPLFWFGGESGVSGPREVYRIQVELLFILTRMLQRVEKEPVTEFIYL